MNKSENKCPYCGYEHYRLVKEGSTFDGPILRKQCLKCGGRYDQIIQNTK